MQTKTGSGRKGRDWNEILKRYLGQYVRAMRRRRQLEVRLRNICREMDAPIGGINYSPVNASSSEVSTGSAAFTLRKSEIESRIGEQKKQTEERLLKVMDILDYLEPVSDERIVLELKYIDNLSWNEIRRKICLSRSSCFDAWNRGIDTLLTFKRVHKILEEYADKTIL